MEKLEQAVSALLDAQPGYCRQEDGTFAYEIYADYRDEMDSKTAIRILRSEDPVQTFWEQLDEWYRDYQWALGDELEQALRAGLTDSNGPYPEGLSDEDDAALREMLMDMVYYRLPSEHFMRQSFYTNIMVDTGDGNYTRELKHLPIYRPHPPY